MLGRMRPVSPRPVSQALLLSALLASAAPAFAAKVADVQVRGLDPVMTENVKRSLSLIDSIGRDVSGRRMSYLVREAEAQTREALEPFGYYSPTIKVERTRVPDAPVTVTIDVQLGDPVRVIYDAATNSLFLDLTFAKTFDNTLPIDFDLDLPFTLKGNAA